MTALGTGGAGNAVLVKSPVVENRIDAIIHFAVSIVVPEQAHIPPAYRANNTCTSRNFFGAGVEYGVECFLFSSTAAR